MNDWLTLREAAALCGLSTKTLERRITDGTLTARMVHHGKRPVRQVWRPSLDVYANLPQPQTPTSTPHGQIAPTNPNSPMQLTQPILDTLRQEHADTRTELRALQEELAATRAALACLSAQLAAPPWWLRAFRRLSTRRPAG